MEEGKGGLALGAPSNSPKEGLREEGGWVGWDWHHASQDQYPGANLCRVWIYGMYSEEVSAHAPPSPTHPLLGGYQFPSPHNMLPSGGSALRHAVYSNFRHNLEPCIPGE